MLKYLILSLMVSGVYAGTFSEKYASYGEKLQKERERFSNSRDLKAETRRWANDIDKLTNRRDFIDKTRELRASVRKEMRRIF